MGIVALALLLEILVVTVAEPWIERKIRTVLAEESIGYEVKVEDIDVSLLAASITLKTITIASGKEPGVLHDLQGEIAQVSLEGIGLWKALFQKKADVDHIRIGDIRISGEIPTPKSPPKARPPVLSPTDIRIGGIHFDNLELALKNMNSAKAYAVKKGDIRLGELRVAKKDTISAELASGVTFRFGELNMITADSMYTLVVKGMDSGADAPSFSINSLVVRPNHADYEFTARQPYETDRIEGGFQDLVLHDFSMQEYLKSGSLKSSYVEIGKMNLDVFRDKRKPFPPGNRPAFQELLYEYPDLIQIDSLGIAAGSVVYREHAEEANQPGQITFQELRAKLYNISNDTVYKTKKGHLELNAQAMLMGKSRLVVALKAPLYAPDNGFSVDGNLSAMEASHLNPILEKNGFIFVTSGTIDNMHFNFNANDYAAKGNMELLYHDLDVAIKNKRTDDTTALKEKLLSFLANAKIVNANPVRDKEARKGIIDYERDPTRFVFNYFVKALLSGIKSTIFDDAPKEKKKSKKKKG